jgi:hypothetical protein
MAADKSPVELAAAEEELALGARASQVTFRTLLAQDPGSLHSGDHHRGSLCTTDDTLDP